MVISKASILLISIIGLDDENIDICNHAQKIYIANNVSYQ